MINRRNLVILSALVLGSVATTTYPVLAKSKTLTGTVRYDKLVKVPAGSVLEVTLQDVSFADKAAKVIAKKTLKTSGLAPIAYSLKYDDKALKKNGRYSLSARITVNGKLALITTTNHLVEAGKTIDGNIAVEKVAQ